MTSIIINYFKKLLYRFADVNVASEDTDHLEQDPLPLRIIMQAPHLHGREMKKHTYLILKVGDPKFHGHLNSEIDVTPINSQQVLSISCLLDSH